MSASKPHSVPPVAPEEIVKATEMVRSLVQGEIDGLMAENARLEEQLEAEKEWGRKQADFGTEVATKYDALKEQLESLVADIPTILWIVDELYNGASWRGMENRRPEINEALDRFTKLASSPASRRSDA